MAQLSIRAPTFLPSAPCSTKCWARCPIFDVGDCSVGCGFRGGPGQRFQCKGEILGGLEALLGLLLQAAAHNALESRRDGMVHLAEFRRIFFQDCRHGLCRSIAEGSLPRNRDLGANAAGYQLLEQDDFVNDGMDYFLVFWCTVALSQRSLRDRTSWQNTSTVMQRTQR